MVIPAFEHSQMHTSSSRGMQVYAHLQVCEKQHGLLVINGGLRVSQDLLPPSWVELQPRQGSQQHTSEEHQSSDDGQLRTSGPNLADMVCSSAFEKHAIWPVGQRYACKTHTPLLVPHIIRRTHNQSEVSIIKHSQCCQL